MELKKIALSLLLTGVVATTGCDPEPVVEVDPPDNSTSCEVEGDTGTKSYRVDSLALPTDTEADLINGTITSVSSTGLNIDATDDETKGCNIEDGASGVDNMLATISAGILTATESSSSGPVDLNAMLVTALADDLLRYRLTVSDINDSATSSDCVELAFSKLNEDGTVVTSSDGSITGTGTLSNGSLSVKFTSQLVFLYPTSATDTVNLTISAPQVALDFNSDMSEVESTSLLGGYIVYAGGFDEIALELVAANGFTLEQSQVDDIFSNFLDIRDESSELAYCSATKFSNSFSAGIQLGASLED